MTPATHSIIRTAILADGSLTDDERNEYLNILSSPSRPIARPEPIMSVTEAARCLGVTNRRVTQLCREDRLKAVRIGKSRATRVTVASVANLINPQSQEV